MRYARTWLYVFLPFLYLTILLGLVAVQFSKKNDSFSQSLGELTVTGKTPAAGQTAELSIRARGLVFTFGGKHPLQVISSEGPARLRPLSWTWRDGNAVVRFEQGLELVFEKAEGGRSLLIHPVGTGASKRFTQIRIGFGADGGARLVHGARTTLMEVLRDSDRLLASVDGIRDRIDVDHSFVLTAGPSGFRPGRLDPVVPGVPSDLAWFVLDKSMAPADAEAALAKYWDKALVGWNSATTFSSVLVDAWGREALKRGIYPETFVKLQRLQGLERSEWTFGAMAYLGNMVNLTAEFRRNVEAASSRSQPDWATAGRLWLDATYYGPEGSADRVKRLLLTGDLPSTAAGLVVVFRNLMDIQQAQPAPAVAARLEEVSASLRALVVRREGRLFVEGASGLLDLRSGLLLGRLWLRYAENLAYEAYTTVGTQLVLSALAYQDASGRIPEFLVTQDGAVVRQEGWISPESVYSVVRPAAALEVPLPQWGARAFLRAPSTIESVQISSTKARFVLRFPTATAEHIVIAGVPPFDHLTLHGIRWRTDPQFQSYSDGWYYSASTATLFLKVKHRDDLEEITIYFQPEE